MKMKISQGGMILTFALFLALGAALILGYLLWREVEATQRLHGEIEALEMRQLTAGQLAALLADHQTTFQQIDRYFVDQSTLPRFIEELENLATSSRVKLEVTAAELVSGPPPRVSLRLAASGSFPDLFRLLALLDVFPAKLDFHTVELRRAGAAGKGSAPWSLLLDLELLSFLDQHD